MSNLLKERARTTEKTNQKKKQEQRKITVGYTLDGRAERQRLSKGKRAALTFCIVLCSLAALIYLPPLFYKEPEGNTEVPITPDSSAIKTYLSYLKDHPDDDFDEDGLSNSLEEEHGTDPWNADSDYDGVSDYAELFITQTSPTDATSVLTKQVSTNDEKNGESLSTPYKIDDIIFWPDDYASKSYGSVVRTLSGYRFWNYTGWVKFPETVYAYGYRDGVHYELEHKENEDAWKIDSSDEIFLYKNPLTFVHCLKIPFVDTIYLEDSGTGKLLSKILPSKGGLINCYRAAVIDTQPKTKGDITATLRSPLIDRTDSSRLGINTNSLKDLSWLRKQIEANECVAVSLYSSNVGEAIGIVYGYTKEGDLLVADENLNPVGTIKITECAMNMMDKDGNIGPKTWFAFRGLGFDSAKYGDRISFFASTITGADDNATAPSVEVQEETQSESQTESESEIQPETVTEIPDETPLEETEQETQSEIAVFGLDS